MTLRMPYWKQMNQEAVARVLVIEKNCSNYGVGSSNEENQLRDMQNLESERLVGLLY